MLSISAPKALLLNFTADSYHWGCYGTSIEIYQTLTEHGYYVEPVSVMTTHSASPTPEQISDFDSNDFFQRFQVNHFALVHAIASSDLVVINGEGTLHRTSKGALNLLYLMHVAKRFFGKTVALINSSCYPSGSVAAASESNAYYEKVFPHLDYVALREDTSVGIAREQLGATCANAFDSLPRFIKRHRLDSSHTPRGYVLFSGGISLTQEHIASFAAIAQELHQQGAQVRVLSGAKSAQAQDEKKFIELLTQFCPTITEVRANSMDSWLKTIAHANVLVSGRFHHTIAALTLGTPCAVLPSNTPKISAMLDTIGEGDKYIPKLDREQFFRLKAMISSHITSATTDISETRVEQMCARANVNFATLGVNHSLTESRAHTVNPA